MTEIAAIKYNGKKFVVTCDLYYNGKLMISNAPRGEFVSYETAVRYCEANDYQI